jgi:hypothetical protein
MNPATKGAWAYGPAGEWDRIFDSATVCNRIPAEHLHSEKRRGGDDSLQDLFKQDLESWE